MVLVGPAMPPNLGSKHALGKLRNQPQQSSDIDVDVDIDT